MYCYAKCRNPDCRYAECHYAECRYAECRYAECRGALAAHVCSLYVYTIISMVMSETFWHQQMLISCHRKTIIHDNGVCTRNSIDSEIVLN
jgi:hypothetical protein